MKKSELRALIKEMLQEELAAMDQPNEQDTPAAADDVTDKPETEVLEESISEEETLTEAPVLDRPAERTKMQPVGAGTYADIAVDVQISPEFEDAFYIDGTVYGDEVLEVIDAAVAKAYPNLDKEAHEAAVIGVRAELAKIMSSSDAYSDDVSFNFGESDDEILSNIYSNYFDENGDQY